MKVSTLAGNGELFKQLKYPFSATSIESNKIVISEVDARRISVIDLEEQSLKVLAGSGLKGRNDGAAASASFSALRSVCFGPNGELYIADSFNNIIRKLEDGNISTYAGGDAKGEEDSENNPTAATFFCPAHMEFDPYNPHHLYVADSWNGLVRVIHVEGNQKGKVETYRDQNGVARFNKPGWIGFSPVPLLDEYPSLNCVVPDGFQFVLVDTFESDPEKRLTRQILAGSRRGFRDGPRLDALFQLDASGLFAPNGDFYILDKENHKIRLLRNGYVTTFTGYECLPRAPDSDYLPQKDSNDQLAPKEIKYVQRPPKLTTKSTLPCENFVVSGLEDGSISTAKFRRPSCLIWNGENHLLVCDAGNHVIRKIWNVFMPFVWRFGFLIDSNDPSIVTSYSSSMNMNPHEIGMVWARKFSASASSSNSSAKFQTLPISISLAHTSETPKTFSVQFPSIVVSLLNPQLLDNDMKILKDMCHDPLIFASAYSSQSLPTSLQYLFSLLTLLNIQQDMTGKPPAMVQLHDLTVLLILLCKYCQSFASELIAYVAFQFNFLATPAKVDSLIDEIVFIPNHLSGESSLFLLRHMLNITAPKLIVDTNSKELIESLKQRILSPASTDSNSTVLSLDARIAPKNQEYWREIENVLEELSKHKLVLPPTVFHHYPTPHQTASSLYVLAKERISELWKNTIDQKPYGMWYGKFEPDFTIELSDAASPAQIIGSLKVHDWILYSKWPMFSSTLEAGLAEESSRSMTFTTEHFASLDLLKRFIQYIYTDHMAFSLQEHIHFLDSGFLLGITDTAEIPHPGFVDLIYKAKIDRLENQ